MPRALSLRFALTCRSIRFWRAVREWSDHRYKKAIDRGNQQRSALNLRGALTEVCER